jgi:hypothetical protein
MNASITIGIDDYNVLKSRITALEGELGQAHTALEEARLGSPDSDIRQLAAAFGYALEVVQFAVANLHPLTVRGWPYLALRALARLSPDLPGVDTSFRQVARGDWEILTREMEKWEKARAEGREQELLAEENAARAPGADHPIYGGAAQP